MPTRPRTVASATASRLPSIAAAEAALHPPRLRDGLVGRAPLINRLRTEQSPVVVVTAPAGYGKTTLLAQWAQRDPRTFAWAAIRAEDNDPASFVELLTAALGDVVELDEALAPRADRRASSARAGSRRLARFLFENATPLVVVLDGVEELVSPDALEIVDLLCDHASAATHIVVSGRTAPHRLLARLRAEGRLAEVGRRDLELTDREVTAVLHHEGVEAAPAEVAELNRRAEGWVTGVYLSALALRTSYGRSPRRVGSVGGSHRFIAEYFESQVLDRLTPDEGTFVTELAVLDRFAGPVCDALLAGRGSGAKLRHLDELGSFLVPLDRERTWYRFHTFLRDTLRRTLEQEQPERFAELSRRSAEWYVSAGDRPRAIEYLLAIGDGTEATKQLGQSLPDLVARGVLTRIEPALAELDHEEVLLGDQAAAIAGAFVYALLGDVDATARWSSIADRAAPAGPTSDGTESSATWGSVLHAAFCESGVERMREDASAAVEQVDHGSPLYALASFLVGIADLIGRPSRPPAETFTAALAIAESTDAPLVASMALAELSLLAQASDEWTLGETLARRACDLADEVEPTAHAAACLAYTASVRSALRNSNWVRAHDHTERAHALLPSCTGALPWLAVQVRLELAHAHLALNDSRIAHELLTVAEQILVTNPHLGRLAEDAKELRVEISLLPEERTGTRGSLTAAELRLLPLLTTHLTFRQIAEHLYVSRNTIKTQAISVYRKLGASSRTEAIDRAIEVGLLRPEGEVVDRLG